MDLEHELIQARRHSIALACPVGVLVMLQAYLLTGMIVHQAINRP